VDKRKQDVQSHMIGAMFIHEFMYKVINKLYSTVYFVRLWSREKDSRVLWTINEISYGISEQTCWLNGAIGVTTWKRRVKNTVSKSFRQKVLNFLKNLFFLENFSEDSTH
jgi:hypothetical protein